MMTTRPTFCLTRPGSAVTSAQGSVMPAITTSVTGAAACVRVSRSAATLSSLAASGLSLTCSASPWSRNLAWSFACSGLMA